ncbi:TetR/AcrR family transcriptional regulator [Amycolatopsis sp. OK19-0408]|uniref:TetR/AcrR family transcriptional regulator n=1 Tax=Amycolatopsis iheyensis TaxID=2945988 RepID=A0A9X2SPB6_9PSEU|nr:TetR/AcrR family transcriptional regulator [Amycolatopsis iheyensis]MCR6487345.1 TetR/AcrR family transcriptional regulator [Amycolatopsis iheyensis]
MAEATAVRSRRPANRRELIVEAAAALFADRGFEFVSVGDIAERVGFGPSALYRHFAGKDELLGAAVDHALDRLADALDGVTAGSDVRRRTVDAVARFALDHRTAAVLWEREARNLPPDAFAARAAKLAGLRTTFVEAVEGAPAQLAGRMAFAILLSPAFHHGVLPPAKVRSVLAETAFAVLDAETTVPAPSTAPVPPGLARGTKREQILQTALRIFTEQTYSGTGMTDIAAAVGLSASSIYNHFGTKAEILLEALNRGNGYLQVTLDDALREAGDEAAALRRLVAVYSAFAVRHSGFVDALVTELRSLGDQAEPLIQAQRDYVGEWIRLCVATRRDLDEPRAQFVVQAVLMAVNEIARERTLSPLPGIDAALAELATAALLTPDGGAGSGR